ncbi:MAG: dTMP kinase [Planctomycetota bacterium]
MSGFFLTLDGIDGAGKSTLLDGLCQWFRSQKNRVVTHTRDPGGTSVGGEIRRLMLDSDLRIHPRTEATLFMASRSEMVAQIIQPALDRGEVVISDRYLLSTVVYQSNAGLSRKDQDSDAAANATSNLPLSTTDLWEIGRWAAGGRDPDLTLLLDLPADVSMRRLAGHPDRMEARGLEYMQRVRQSFLCEVSRAGGAWKVLDATLTPEQLLVQAIQSVQELIHSSSPLRDES